MMILVVEDHDSQRALFAEALEEAGYQVVALPGVRSCRAAAVSLAPDLMVLDHLLADGTHADVVALWPQSRYLVVSGLPAPEDFGGCWLLKPVSGRQLVDCVRYLMGGGP